MLDERFSSLRVPDGFFPRYVCSSPAPLAGSKLLIVDGGAIDLHRVTF